MDFHISLDCRYNFDKVFLEFAFPLLIGLSSDFAAPDPASEYSTWHCHASRSPIHEKGQRSNSQALATVYMHSHEGE